MTDSHHLLAAILILGLGLPGGAVLLWGAVVSWREREYRAAQRLLLLAGLIPVGVLALFGATAAWGAVVPAVLAVLGLAGTAWLLMPGDPLPPAESTPPHRHDERATIFARRALEPGSERFAAHYRAHPDQLAPDQAARARPGLLAPGAALHDPVPFAAAEAAFAAVAAFHPLLDAPRPDRPSHSLQPEAAAAYLKGFACKLGAVAAGVTELRPGHLYSHIGRGPRWGEPVATTHTHALALAVEMDREMLSTAPASPVTMESAQQYLASGAVAVTLAEAIRHLGYDARAHIDGSYRVVCPLVARDAGLGEIGRMGLLMTPRLGPRIRLAVVTTDLPLATDPARPDPSVIDFCRRCRKCADACPARAIPDSDRPVIDGVRRWRIDSERCYDFWCRSGTDCGRCMHVCPYSHPDHPLHNIVRAGLRRSARFRALALWMDDWLYGRVPPAGRPPGWLYPLTRQADGPLAKTPPAEDTPCSH